VKNKPIKRHSALQNLSREHHDGLVFALRIKKGVAKKASLKDLEAYSNWFWEEYLQSHFQLEEEHLFPLLSEENSLVVKAIRQHQELALLFNLPSKTHSDYTEMQLLLNKHIRFEERELFNLMQEVLPEATLKEFEKLHTEQHLCSIWDTEFWK
jgi:hemerythrin-like domain-containing protein